MVEGSIPLAAHRLPQLEELVEPADLEGPSQRPREPDEHDVAMGRAAELAEHPERVRPHVRDPRAVDLDRLAVGELARSELWRSSSESTSFTVTMSMSPSMVSGSNGELFRSGWRSPLDAQRGSGDYDARPSA